MLQYVQAKAFDKKTSVLHYLVKLVKQNDDMLAGFHNDLGHVRAAENVILDGVCADIIALKDELVKVHETTKDEAQRMSDMNMLNQMSLRELMEQRTSIRTVQSVPQFNRMDHLTGRTPMERFTLGAASMLDEAIALVHEVKGKYVKLLEYFGEDANMASNDFFGTIRRFITEFGAAAAQVEKEEKAKVRIRCFECVPRPNTSVYSQLRF
jgi:hypothetical protein